MCVITKQSPFFKSLSEIEKSLSWSVTVSRENITQSKLCIIFRLFKSKQAALILGRENAYFLLCWYKTLFLLYTSPYSNLQRMFLTAIACRLSWSLHMAERMALFAWWIHMSILVSFHSSFIRHQPAKRFGLL